MWQHKSTLCMLEVAQTEPLSAPGLNSSLVFSLWWLWEVQGKETCLLCIFEGGLSYTRRLEQLSRMKAEKDMVILHKIVERSGTGQWVKPNWVWRNLFMQKDNTSVRTNRMLVNKSLHWKSLTIRRSLELPIKPIQPSRFICGNAVDH